MLEESACSVGVSAKRAERCAGTVQSLSGYEQYFAMARGVTGIQALDMSKFFDTNYHYLVPELTATVCPKPDFDIILDKVKRGQAAIGKDKAVPIIIGELPGSCCALIFIQSPPLQQG